MVQNRRLGGRLMFTQGFVTMWCALRLSRKASRYVASGAISHNLVSDLLAGIVAKQTII